MQNRTVSLITILFWFGLIFTTRIFGQWSNDATKNDTIIVHPANQTHPVIVTDGSNGAIIAWQDDRNGNADIFAIRLRASGKLTWRPGGEPVAELDGDQQAPAIAENADGAFIVWQDNRNNPSLFELFAQRIEKSLGQGKWTANGILVQGGNNTPPKVIRDSIFGYIVASYTNVFADFAMLVQKVNNNGVLQWREFNVVSQAMRAPQPMQPPQIVSDLNSGVIAVWPDRRSQNLALYAAHIVQEGKFDTTWNEVLLGNSISENTEPALISDGEGGAIIAWVAPQIPGSEDIILVQRLNNLGEKQWGENGKAVSITSGRKRNVKIARVTQDTLVVLWEDLSTGIDWDISAQLINGLTGDRLGNEFDLVGIPGDQIKQQIINNQRGAVIIAWEDNRNNDSDIYAQLLLPNGDVRWGTNGFAVSTASGQQKNPQLVDDGLGGAIIVWEDSRDGTNTDIYAQRVSEPGVLGEFRMLTVLTPNRGEQWEIGSTQELTWNSRGEIDSVAIELSRDGGRTFPEILIPSTLNDGSESWVVKGPASSACKIRIRAVGAEFILDESDSLFVIANPKGPTIQHVPTTQATFGDSLQITTRVTDVSGLKNVVLHFRKAGDAKFDSINMLPQNENTFTKILPATVVTERGVEYFITSEDNIGNSSKTDTFFVRVRFNSGVQITQIPGGSAQNAYRMISAPNLLDQTLVDSLFTASGFGVYDTTSWRMFHYQNGTYVEHDSTFSFELGKAFWVISQFPRTIDFGSGISIQPRPFTIQLDPGWNQIGLPFAFPVAWQDIMQASKDSASIEGPFEFLGSYNLAETLRPFSGYFVFNNDSTRRVSLKIPPRSSSGGSTTSLLKISGEQNWSIQIIANCQQARDDFNYLGVHKNALEGKDRLDYVEPPPVGEYVSVYFPHQDWGGLASKFTTDFTGDLKEGKIWNLEVESNIASAQIDLTFEGVENLKPSLKVILIDESLNYQQDLREVAHYTIPTGPSGIKKRLKIAIGGEMFITDEVGRLASIPETFELSQNFPNPFNPSTVIRYGLPKSEKVTLRIYDLLGREVITLVDGKKQKPGYHLVHWDGRDKFGRNVASGVYIYRIQAGTFLQSRKMVLVK